MNLDDLIAIDFHTHAEEPCNCHRDDGYNEFQAGMAAYFKNPAGIDGMLPTVPQTAAHYRAQNIAAVIFPVDAERETGYRRYANEEVARLAAENADVLIPFASIDPAKGKLGAREARRLVRDFGIRGFKFHPSLQAFEPNDRRFYPVYEAIAGAGVPALFHTGQTGVGQVHILEPLQTVSLVQVPHEPLERPHALLTEPHCAPPGQAGAGHTHWLLLHCSSAPHMPLFGPHITVRITPQLSAAVLLPHVAPVRAQNAASVSGTHMHTLFVQDCPGPQLPLLGPQVA